MKKSEKYAVLSTLLFTLIVLLMLLFVYLPQMQNIEEEGVMISFGEVMDAAGAQRNTPTAEAASTPTSPPPPVPERREELLTQTEPSVALPQPRQEPRVQQPSREELQRREQERFEQQRIEQQRREQQAAQAADNVIGGAFGPGNAPASGTGQSTVPAGNPIGSGTVEGNTWSLRGRGLEGKLILPLYEENVEGFVRIEIRVNASGIVVSARVIGGTIGDTDFQQAAREAALRTRFSAGTGDVIGTITYNFKFKVQ